MRYDDERYCNYDDDEETHAALLYSLRLRASRYRVEIREYPDGQFYWHLFVRSSGERVNGGLNDSREEASAAASQAIGWRS
jgi:hypothetical protein